MYVTKKDEIPLLDKLAVDTPEVMQLFSCGRHTAVEIGEKAGAKLRFGKRVLWSVPKLKEFIAAQVEE